MGLGKITRGLGKVGLAFEARGYVVAGAKALVRAIKRAPDARRDDDVSRQEPDGHIVGNPGEQG